MTRISFAIATIVLLSMGVLSIASSARADGPFEGDWRAGPMRIDITVESWGGDCGPRPQSTTVPGGRTIHVTQSGDDLTFAGRPARSTTGCWSENTAVRRVSRSYQAGTWRIVCRTPEEDPRAETGTYTLTASGSDRIEFRDVSRYDWQLNESQCRATLTSTQTFERVSGATPEPQPQPQPEPEPETRPEPACTPGAPARIQIRPAEAAIEPGGRQCFSARVVDASGCAVPGRPVQLELRSPPGVTGTLRGTCFQAAGNAAEAEGEFTIIGRSAAAGGTASLEAQATLRVRTPDLSDLIARRAEGGGAVSVTGGEATSEQAARVAARSEAARGGWILPVAGGAIALVLLVALVGALVARSRRSKKKIAALEAEAVAAPGASVPDQAPLGQAPLGRAPLAQAPQAQAPIAAPVAPGEPKICPSCRRGHPPDATRCSVDGTPLVLYADFVAGKAGPAASASKVCPVCGSRFPATTRFCGKDGATLVDG